MITPRELKAIYDKGENVVAYLRKAKGLDYNSEEIIELAYDLQAGSYIEIMNNQRWAEHVEAFTTILAKKILALCQPKSVLEVGIGEATTFSSMVRNLGGGAIRSYGFDLSWSRVAFARQWLEHKEISGATLCTGSLFNIPFADNSVDIVYTYHSIEPNGGYEEPILREIYRVARKYVVLMESGYELADKYAQQRMEMHGYCRDIKKTIDTLGYKVLEYGVFQPVYDPANLTALTIIEKQSESKEATTGVLVCPKYRTALQEIDGVMYSSEALSVYPIIGGIPCLKISDAMVATRYLDVVSRGQLADGKV
jgi:ubiquinone/menaquinone biosynthesis C-methylase UbiE